MIFYENIIETITGVIKSSCGNINFTVDIPKNNIGYDLYSNAPKILKNEFEIKNDCSLIENLSFENGFLNIVLNDKVFFEFLSDFRFSEEDFNSDIDSKLHAYIQLAENEKRCPETGLYCMPLTSEVRRIILFLMKIQSLSSSDTKKIDIMKTEISELLDKLRFGCDNLKEFVLTYEPLLIAVRGSLVNY